MTEHRKLDPLPRTGPNRDAATALRYEGEPCPREPGAVERGVTAAYELIEEYIRRGREAARARHPGAGCAPRHCREDAMRDPFSTAMFAWSEMARFWLGGNGGCCESECGACGPRHGHGCGCSQCVPGHHHGHGCGCAQCRPDHHHHGYGCGCAQCRPDHHHGHGCGCPQCRPDHHHEHPGQQGKCPDVVVRVVVFGPPGTRVTVMPAAPLPAGPLVVRWNKKDETPSLSAKLDTAEGVLAVEVEVKADSKLHGKAIAGKIFDEENNFLGALRVEVPATAEADK